MGVEDEYGANFQTHDVLFDKKRGLMPQIN